MELTVKLTGLYRDRKFSDRYKIQTNTIGNLTLKLIQFTV